MNIIANHLLNQMPIGPGSRRLVLCEVLGCCLSMKTADFHDGAIIQGIVQFPTWFYIPLVNILENTFINPCLVWIPFAVFSEAPKVGSYACSLGYHISCFFGFCTEEKTWHTRWIFHTIDDISRRFRVDLEAIRAIQGSNMTFSVVQPFL